MLSKILLFLIFLGNVDKVSSPIDKRCEWFCKTTAKIPQTADKMEVWLNISKRIDQKCAANKLYRNLQNTTTTGYVFVSSLRDYHDGFSFVQFTTTTTLEHTFQTEEINKTAMNVSCLLQPKSNQAEMAVSNGLDALNSLRFYISFDNQSWNIPFVGYVHLETKHYISVGSNENVSEDHELTMTSFDYILSWLIRIGYITFFPQVLTWFCHTLKKINKKYRGRGPEESDFHASSVSSSLSATTSKAREHDDECYDKGNPVLQQTLSVVPSIIKAENKRNKETQFPEPPAESHRSEDMETADSASKAENKRDKETQFPEPPAESHRSEDMETADSASESEMGGDYVDVIDVGGPGSPVGIRSFLSKFFLNMTNTNEEKWKNVRNGIVRFVILIMFSLSILPWIDVFVLGMPGLFLRGSTNMPSPFLTELVFTFAFKKCPGLFACAFVFFIVRMFFLSFVSSPSTTVPSFIHRKHLICFLSTSDVFKVLFPNYHLSVCEECDEIEASESSNVSSIPHKIQQYLQTFRRETLKRNWKDVSEKLVKQLLFGNQEHLPVPGKESSSSECWKDESGNQVKNSPIVKYVLAFVLFIVVTAVDCIISLPIVSLCHGGCWYTVNRFENKFVEALLLLLEFVCIFFSIVWAVYFSYCCSSSLQIAIGSFIISGIKYPIETLSSLSIFILTWHSIWMLYNFFTNDYFSLLAQLSDICSKDHHNEMVDYTIEYKMYIPKDLFNLACEKFKPVTENLRKLVRKLFLYTILYVIIFSFVGGTKFSKKSVLPPTVAFLIIFHPSLWDFLKKRGEEETAKKSDMEKQLKNLADAYFNKKIN